jgi:protein-S-isoprenylcysteine O-methyltransferase Ste14
MKTDNSHQLTGKILYSLAFLVILPAGLALWSCLAALNISLPAVQSDICGIALLASGAFLMLSGMYALWHFGGGLPMNAYPPPKFVTEGAFRLLPHPIYTGFVLVCFGAAVYSGSAAGLWLVSPTALAGCAALVWGYEGIDLKERFPGEKRRYLLSIPANSTEKPSPWDRISVFVCLYLPWVLLNGAAILIHRDHTNYMFSGGFGFDQDGYRQFLIPAAWGLMILAPLVARTQAQLRRFFIGGVVGGGLVLYLALVAPVIGLGHNTRLDEPVLWKALESLNWFWIWLSASLLIKAVPGIRFPVYGVCALLTPGLILASSDPVAHAITGWIGLAGSLFYPAVWEFLRRSAEIIANSWREWVIGPVRIISHGFYVGAAAFTGMILGGWLAGPEYVFAMVVFGVIVTVCAGLWGQYVEGSDKLKRPFGFYGAMLGIILASLTMRWMGVEVWVMLGIFSVFMPWVQGIGRFRCLVNGCCHGAGTSDLLGIRYTHPRSRVCYVSGLKGQPLHPTQLYSMLWLAVVGGLQLKLWLSGVAPSLIFGTYLILNGLGRFVEEALRGEPQTPVMAGLRLYQWAAMVSVLAGIIISCLPARLPALTPGITWQSLAWAGFMWIFVQFMMGIDFPKSNRRFSRLA